MAFEEIKSLDCDTTISLGGTNKKTGKKNPTQIEGYYLGSRTVADQKKKSGVSYIHVLQTKDGNTGVWGKTNLDNKMKSVTPGFMIRITQSGMQSTPNGDMYLYKVEVDKENTVDVAGLNDANNSDADNAADYEAEEEAGLDEDEAPADEVPVSRPSPSQRPTANAPDAARQAKVQAMLAGKGRRTA